MRLIVVRKETTTTLFGPPLYSLRKGMQGKKNVVDRSGTNGPKSLEILFALHASENAIAKLANERSTRLHRD